MAYSTGSKSYKIKKAYDIAISDFAKILEEMDAWNRNHDVEKNVTSSMMSNLNKRKNIDGHNISRVKSKGRIRGSSSRPKYAL